LSKASGSDGVRSSNGGFPAIEMHVGLNLIYLVPGETGGMETYARELIPALVAARPDIKFTAFLNQEADASREGPWCALTESIAVPVRASRRSEWVRGEQLLLPRLATRAAVDILHSLGSTSPARGRFHRVTTIHDVIYRIFPEAHGALRARAMGFLIPLSARRSHRIIVPSASTRSDVVEHLHLPDSKIDVVPLGIGSRAVAPTPEQELRTRLGLDRRSVVLTTSAKRPHKNLARLLDAWALLPEETRPVLVLTGYSTPYEAELRQHSTELGLDTDTRFLGWVSSADLEGLFAVASCFVFPSLYEGFGLPVLEAMARGVPIACSDTGSLAEVAGGGALLFDPENPTAIADAVQSILDSEALRTKLRAAGDEQARRFTWKAAAEGTLQTYERVLADSS
jgi:glycosyltransferase involved in cell wall biosynthesis